MSEQIIVRADVADLPRIQDRMTFIYLEMCEINRSDGAITAKDSRGVYHIPANTISTILLGPGTTVTHRAAELMGDCGVTIIWVGEKGVRYYASGRPMTHQAKLLIRQAELVSNQRKHLAVVRKMYQMRFPDEDVSSLTLQQLRGREGARVRNLYRQASEKYGVEWNGRKYDSSHFEDGDPVNQALSCANACLYGLAHAVIVSLGCSAGLGFVHVGHENSFVYDIADLYKADVTIPVAFECAAKGKEQLTSTVRRRVRDEMVDHSILERMVKDIYALFADPDDSENEEEEKAPDVLCIWDLKENLEAGIQYEEAGK